MFNRRLLSLLVALSATGAVQAQDQTNTNESEDGIFIEEVYVQGIRNAELNARQAEKTKEAFSSVIAQDDAGNFADQNVAESLQRLPGVTLQKSEGEGQRVNMRGLGPQYVNVTINGSELASSGGDDRSFGLDVISADMLGGIEVNKTILPSMDTYSTAGSVNLKTVSAFEKKKDSLKLKAQVNEQLNKEDLNPKLSISGTNLFADDTFGVGYSLSGEKRKTVNYEVLHHERTSPRYIDPEGTGNPMLIPWESQVRQEDAERTRYSGSLDLGWRPNDNSEYNLRMSHTEYEDLDIAIREYYRFSGASGSELIFIDPNSNTFGVTDADLQQQFFIQKSKVETDAIALEGEHIFAEEWTLDYRFAHSKSENNKPDGRRVQFRVRDLPMVGSFGEDYIRGIPTSREQMISLGGVTFENEDAEKAFNSDTKGADDLVFGASGLPQAYQPGLKYDNIFIEDSFREDIINSFNINLQKDFDSNLVSYVKAGIQVKARERNRDRNRVSIVPGNYSDLCSSDGNVDDPVEQACKDAAKNTVHGDVDTYMPSHSGFNFEHITYDAAEALLATTRALADNFDPGQVDQSSRDQDYQITEDTSAAYIEAKFDLSDVSSIIAGVRYNQTDFESTGNFTIRNDRFEIKNDVTSLDVSIPFEQTSNSYTDIHPSVHFRYEPSDEYLIRAALWTSGTRPGFNQSRAYAKFDGRIEVCNNNASSEHYKKCDDDPGDIGATSLDNLAEDFVVSSANTISLGNPVLDPMFSTNFDTSIGWYASEDLFLQAAFFYKDIKDFIVQVRGVESSIEDLPVQFPLGDVPYFNFVPNTGYESVNFNTNGESASVYGVELSYVQYFSSDVFVQSNATLLDSEANMGDTVRADTIKMPNMAATTLNLVLGWENEYASVRLIGNYTSKILDQVGSCTANNKKTDIQKNDGIPKRCQEWNDVYYDEVFNLDFKATYEISDTVSVYFDAINLTEEKTLRYLEGNQYSGGHIMYRSEDFGTSVQLGVNWKIY